MMCRQPGREHERFRFQMRVGEPQNFLGSDAEVRANDNRSFTTLSLATKSSYKKDGKYISHTEWHRCVVFGKLAEFAGTLKFVSRTQRPFVLTMYETQSG